MTANVSEYRINVLTKGRKVILTDMNSDKLDRKHYSFTILIALIVLKIGAGAAAACTANFIAPVVKEFGCMVSQFTLMTSIMAVSMSLLYTTAANTLNRFRIGRVMGIAALFQTIGIAMLATYHSIGWFYVSGVIIGSSQAFTGLVATPIVVNMWFKKKTGTVLGIVIAVQQISSVCFGLLTGQLITSFGWRIAYVVLAVVMGITVPFLFILMKSPEEVGCEPFGAGEVVAQDLKAGNNNKWGLTLKEALRKPAFWIAWLTCLMYSYGTGGFTHFASYSTLELGESTNFGAWAGMCMSLGGIVCSLLLGRINDRFGVKAGLIWGAFFCAAGFSIAIISKNSHYLIFAGAFVTGLAYSMYTVQCPLIARSVVGDRNYSGIWAVMMVANSLIGGGLSFTIGLFYDKTGTYRGAFIMCIGMFIAALITGSIAVNMAKQYKDEKRISLQE